MDGPVGRSCRGSHAGGDVPDHQRLGLFTTRWAAILLFAGTDIVSISVFLQVMIAIVASLLLFLALRRYIDNGFAQGARKGRPRLGRRRGFSIVIRDGARSAAPCDG